MPGIEQATARSIVDAAHQLCPYSKATRGNMEVALTVA
jgi:organic hydroperoxide reductase OsmC/OhrA